MASAGAVSDPACGELRVVMRTNQLVYALPHGFIRAGTDTVSLGATEWRPGVEYVLDRVRGELRLLREPVSGDTLAVRACWLLLPPPLELSRLRYRPAPGFPADTGAATAADPAPAAATRPATARMPGARDPSAPGGGASLTLSGNKTIAVDFGSNQDAFLRQSLDLAVSGTLAPGVELTGVLSDRNTPLTAGGSTQNLESLDRVLIELKAPQGGASLGDVGLDVRQGEFARLERRLQGMRGEWSVGEFRTSVAAASAPGVYHRLQFFGTEGRQGPYTLTDRDGGLGVSVVAGSEVVTVDGARMTRGESADYSMDYERAQITFSNRRPISSASRITVDYQYSVNHYRRNLVAVGGRWERRGLFVFVQGLTEGDDRGRPLDVTFDATDRARLQASGDSAVRAIGTGVAGGGGDYDTVRVDASAVVYAFAGPDSGTFAVQFARVGQGEGDYSDSSIVAGRTAYRFVGPGNGAYRVGRALPLPETHRLWAAGGGVRLGPLALEAEGAFSHLDRNAFSSLDDGDNRGEAGRAEARLEGAPPGPLAAAGLTVRARAVGQRFAPFGALERPFEVEDWGLPLDADLEHQRRLEVSGYVRPRAGGELRAGLGRLVLPDGFASLRREVEWSRDGTLLTRFRVERADGEELRRVFPAGGRERMRGDLRWRLSWIEPALHAESDARRFPSDTGRVGDRFREAGLDLGSGRALPWKLAAGYALRRDGRRSGAGFADQSEARTLRAAVESPAEGRLGVGMVYQRRGLETLAESRRTRSALGSLRLRGEEPRVGMKGQLNLEVTSEGQSRREKKLVFVGAGQGTYDPLGNFVGTGDYDLVVSVGADLDRVAHSATSALVTWQFGRSDAWRGSRVEFDFESEAGRRGEVKARDPVVSPGAVLGDGDLVRGSVLQRVEAELAPGSRASAVLMRAERRVTADRSYDNFAETRDERTLSARWRARPASSVSTELETRARRQTAAQTLYGGGAFRRVLLESGGTAQLVFTPDARFRAAGTLDVTWSRPEFGTSTTRTVRVGPDLTLAVGARGRAEVSLKRGFISGPPAVALIPTADPIAAPRWEGSTRFDYRVRESATLGLSLTGTDRWTGPTQVIGRAELRAFF